METPNYIASTNDLNSLYNIGIKRFPLSGYARSLYRFLTGDKIEITIPQGNNSQFNVLKNESFDLNEFTISPNPSSGNVSIDYSIENSAIFIITDLNGKRIFEQKLSEKDSNLQLNLNNYSNGVYIFNLFDNKSEKLLMSEKFIKL